MISLRIASGTGLTSYPSLENTCANRMAVFTALAVTVGAKKNP